MSKFQSSSLGQNNSPYNPLVGLYPQQAEEQKVYADSQNYYQAPNDTSQNYNSYNPLNSYNLQQAVETNLYPSTSSHIPNQQLNPINQNPLNTDLQSEEEKLYNEISSRQNFLQTFSEIHPNKSLYNPLNILDKLKGVVLKDHFKDADTPEFIKNINIEDRVETISKSWIKIEQMKNFGKFQQTFINCVDQLLKEGTFAGWKKSRGDGNCYYRAVITKYFELIHKPYHSISHLINFKAILENCIYRRKQQFSNDEYLSACESILSYINYSIEYKKTYPVEIFIKVLEWFQKEDFDLNLVKVARLITYFALQDEKENPQFQDFGMDISWYEGSIMLMGEEAEGFMLIFLPLGLKCQVIQYNFFDKIQVENFPVGENFEIKIPIVRRSGHYDILYTIQEMEYDQYSFDTGKYHFHCALLAD
ncbi:hypothetical protein SteCoe_34860 [Stentor coeruleus]|uniref:ubiquitinyl hydrolase 1 n=1 Tax=Stentor coeruleus TaxID=5963 RepID=A0A1R2ATM0_9CILI|nr:hypothetical protein SteCoe_34860 [Stentor coeruleus]